jgi:AcrR family transcriptional regulator
MAQQRSGSLTPKGERVASGILDAAIEVIAERGAGGASLALVADEAGVDKGLIRYYFGDRDGLIEATVERIGERLLFAAEEALSTIVDPEIGFDRGFDLLWANVTASPRLYAAYLELTAAAVSNRELRVQVAKVRDRYDRLVLERAAVAEENGYEWLIPKETMTQLVLAALEGLALDYLRRGGRADHFDDAVATYRRWLGMLARPKSTD